MYSPKRINIDMDFADALGGHFTPITDKKREHTLARLAKGCVQKGSEAYEVGIGSLHHYHPSWARETLATAVSDVDFNASTISITGLRLSRGPHRLEIYNRFSPQDEIGSGIMIAATLGSLVIEEESHTTTNPERTQRTVAILAEKFFEVAYTDLPPIR